MSPELGALLPLGIAVVVYVAVVVALGLVASRGSSRSPEEYFLAGRGLGSLVLFMALFGTNCTTFVLVGIPGQSWQHGVAVFGLNAAVVALGIPLSFWAIGSPARAMARRLGALTPAELFRLRFRRPSVGWLLVAAFTVYTVPYMVQAVIGAGLTFEQASEGRVSQAWAGAGVLFVAVLYTGLGGMRATAWTNVFQGALFLGFMVVAFFAMAGSLGGFEQAIAPLARDHPELLVRTDDWLFAPAKWSSWGIVISLTVIGFPHMFARLLAARSDRSLKLVCRTYPLALALLWVPAVMIGVWGRGAFPELERPDAIFQAMAQAHLPEWMSTISFLAVLAAVMSTLDAQILTLSSMMTRDVLASGPQEREALSTDDERRAAAQRKQVTAGRLFSLTVAVVVFVLSLVWSRESVFDLSRKAFEGYTTLVPCLFLGVRWKRFTWQGAWASILVGTGLLGLGWAAPEALSLWGFLPVFWAFWGALLSGVLASLASSAPEAAELERCFGSKAARGG